jgi:hypothetical protein
MLGKYTTSRLQIMAYFGGVKAKPIIIIPDKEMPEAVIEQPAPARIVVAPIARPNVEPPRAVHRHEAVQNVQHNEKPYNDLFELEKT